MTKTYSSDSPVPPRASGFLPAEDGHEVYWAEYGNPAGPPVLLVHGSAGNLLEPPPAIDPAKYRIVAIHQRGVGESRPAGRTDHNALPDLVADMERLRRHLAIGSWTLFGWSFGTLVALSYAEAHPAATRGVVAFAPFLGTRAELASTFAVDPSRPFTAQFLSQIGAADAADAPRALLAGLADPARRLATAHAFLLYPTGQGPTLAEVEAWQPAGRERLAGRVEIYARMMAGGYGLGADGIFSKLSGLNGWIHLIVPHSDPFVSVEACERLREALPRASSHGLINCGHDLSSPLVQSKIRNALEDLDPPARPGILRRVAALTGIRRPTI